MTENWLDTLPKKRSASGVMLFNEQNELLLVKPNYKDHWSLPGGIIDEMESPLQAGLREVYEEIGIVLTSLELRCIDYTNNPLTGESYQFVFHGGTLSSEMISSIKLCPEELSEFNFYPIDTALEKLNSNGEQRMKIVLNEDKFVYLQKGNFV